MFKYTIRFLLFFLGIFISTQQHVVLSSNSKNQVVSNNDNGSDGMNLMEILSDNGSDVLSISESSRVLSSSSSSSNVVDDNHDDEQTDDNDDNDDNLESSCASHKTCKNCTTSSKTCHWCESDNACHAVGSIHGCVWGSTCSKDDDNKNHTVDPNDDGGKNHTVDPNDEKTCSAITNCTKCYDTKTCHWCSKDQACHVKGSIYGCSWGTTCTDDNNKNKTKNSTACASYNTCSDCTLSSYFCHWCEHDNACHAVGSKYGCTTGVDCYSNDRCRRHESENLYDHYIFTEMPINTMIGVIIFGCILLCCTTCCYYFAGGVKGAYDDLATMTLAGGTSIPPSSIIGPSITIENNTTTNNNGGQQQRSLIGPTEMYYTNLNTHEEADEEGEEETGAVEAATAAGQQSSGVDEEEANQQVMSSSSSPEQEATTNATTATTTPTPTATEEGNREEGPTTTRQTAPDGSHEHVEMVENHDIDLTSPLLHPQHQQRQQPTTTFSYEYYPDTLYEQQQQQTTHMKRLYRICTICYIFTLFIIVGLVVIMIYLYPQRPIYNVCNDSVAWKKIIENIASLKLDASFEILISVSNPNHISFILEKGDGTFSFDGQNVGTYEIPPTVTAESMSITDLMIIAKVTPDKYQAMQLAEAYYRNELILHSDFKAKIKVPILNNYIYNLHIEDIIVNVTELSDRSLCQCPSWDDDKNHTTTIMTSSSSSSSSSHSIVDFFPTLN